MPVITPEKKIEIIRKHRGDNVFMVAKTEAGLELYSGPLVDADSKAVSVKDPSKGMSATIMPFGLPDKRVIALYNSQLIDLIKLKEPIPLSAKLGGELKRAVIQNLKPFMKDVLYFVYKNKGGIGLCKGKLIDMGLQEFVVSIAPFYNDNLRLNYANVLSIFNCDGVDLADVKPAQ